MANGQYRIVEAQLPLIGGVAGHNFLVLLGPNGQIVGELHGMARDVEGNIKAIGNVPDDRLKSAEYPEISKSIPSTDLSTSFCPSTIGLG